MNFREGERIKNVHKIAENSQFVRGKVEIDVGLTACIDRKEQILFQV